MGHATVPDDNNSLYGFKEDVKENLREKNFPPWLVEEEKRNARKRKIKLTEKTYDKRIEKAKEIAKDYGEGRMEFQVDRKYLPEKISNKLRITREDAQEYIGDHHVSSREYRLIVTVGPQGGIKDVQMGRDFHH